MNGANGGFSGFFGNLLEFHQIGSDQGFLAEPLPAKRLVLAPAERGRSGVRLQRPCREDNLLKSDSFDLLQFRVSATRVNDASTLPSTLRPLARIPESQAVKTRRLTLDENMDLVRQSMGMLLNSTPWHMPVTERPVLNTTEIWELVNLTEDTHPIHLHLVKFQILDPRNFDVFEYRSKGTLRISLPRRPRLPRRPDGKTRFGSIRAWSRTHCVASRVTPGAMCGIVICWSMKTTR